MYRTQKARGLMGLSGRNSRVLYLNSHLIRTVPVHTINVLPHNMPSWKGSQWQPNNVRRGQMFARPCPVTPRHGFVESRRVDTVMDVVKTYAETYAAEAEGETIVMPCLTGKFSAIMTDRGITYGVGHDGVTAGHGQLWDVPCPAGAATLTATFNSGMEDCGASVSESAYVELVEHMGDLFAVQYRDGPKPPAAAKNYVPHEKYVVTRVIKIDNVAALDMLAFEQKVKGAPAGTALVLPGAALSCHAAVHGIAHGFAVLTDGGETLAVGEILEPSSNAPKPLKKAAYRKMARMVRSYMKAPVRYTVNTPKVPEDIDATSREAALFTAPKSGFSTASLLTAIATLHGMAAWGDEDHLLRLRAYGPITLARFLVAALVGEARHFNSRGPGNYEGKKPSVDWNALFDDDISGKISAYSREQVYEKALLLPFDMLLTYAEAAHKDFSGSWGDGDDDMPDWLSQSGPEQAQRLRVEGVNCTCVSCMDSYTMEQTAEVKAKLKKAKLAWAEKHKTDSDEADEDGVTCNDIGGSGYGGPEWKRSASKTIKLLKAIQRFERTKTADAWGEVVAAYNIAVNCAHNGGKLVDKWVPHVVLDWLSWAPQLGLANAVAMRVILGRRASPVFSPSMDTWVSCGYVNGLVPRTVYAQGYAREVTYGKQAAKSLVYALMRDYDLPIQDEIL